MTTKMLDLEWKGNTLSQATQNHYEDVSNRTIGVDGYGVQGAEESQNSPDGARRFKRVYRHIEARL